MVPFLNEKKDLGKKIAKLIKDKMKAKLNKQVEKIWCGNAGENKSMEKLMEEKGLGISFKYTTRKMLQLNGVVKCMFSTM